MEDPTGEKYAKTIYDFETDETFDRTTQPHTYPYDIDLYVPKSPNPKGRRWIYVCSSKSLEEAKKDAKKVLRSIKYTPATARIVESRTGRIIEELEKLEEP